MRLPEAGADTTGAAWRAEVTRRVTGRTRPSDLARALGDIRPRTPWTRSPAGFLALRAERGADGVDWVQIQVASRPNGSTAWVPAQAVVVRPTWLHVVVHVRSRRLELWRGNVRMWSAPAGVGAPATPTPRGRFAVEDLVPVPPSSRTAYGRFVITLTAHSEVLRRFNGGDGQVAIHGTVAPDRVGRATSHGCVVLGAARLRQLRALLEPGTPVVLAD